MALKCAVVIGAPEQHKSPDYDPGQVDPEGDPLPSLHCRGHLTHAVKQSQNDKNNANKLDACQDAVYCRVASWKIVSGYLSKQQCSQSKPGKHKNTDQNGLH